MVFYVLLSNVLSDILSSTLIGAHIGPEPTTDRFVVVMVNQQNLGSLF
jgi:hypothetical protein